MDIPEYTERKINKLEQLKGVFLTQLKLCWFNLNKLVEDKENHVACTKVIELV